jgi:uncharacterized protein YbjT (DUF2867 family)
VPFRALVRPATDAGALEGLASEIVRADFRDPASLPPALAGIVTVVSTVNAIGRLLAGAHDISIRDVDDRGNANLIAAAETAGVERFVYVSMLGDHAGAHTPFTDAKAATERRLRESPLREVVIRPDAFQEVWLGPAGGFDVAAGTVRIYGKGLARRRHVAIDDVAEAVVLLALADDPPRSIDLAGPEPMSASEAATAYEHALGRPLKVSHVPRIVMRVGRTLMRPIKPEVASIMGMALASDLAATQVDDEGFRGLGVEPRAASTFITEVAAART